MTKDLEEKEKGNNFYKQRNYEKAIECYSSAIELNPKETSYYSNRAACYLQLKKYKKAEEDSRASLRVNPNFVKGYFRLGQSLLFLGKFEEAKKQIQKALSIKPNDASLLKEMKKISNIEYYLKKGHQEMSNAQNSDIINQDIKEKTQKFKQAKTQYELALQLAPQSINIKIFISEALIGMGELDKAQEIAQKILNEDDSTNSDALFIRAKCLYYQGSSAIGQKYLTQLLQLDPDNKKAFKLLKLIKKIKLMKEDGNELFKKQEFENAIKKYDEAIQVDPKNKTINSSLYCNKSACYMKLNQYEKAEDEASKAIELDPNYLKAYLRRATCFMKAKKYEKAVRDFNKAHDLDKSDYNIQKKLSEAQKLYKQSKKKDYYKILGCEKNCSQEDIKKQYKKMALRWHPDRFAGRSEREKTEAEEKFKDIGEAYSILSDPQKRNRLDNGWDPSESDGEGVDVNNIFQMFFGGGGSPFGGRGGSPFGGGGSTTFSFGGSPFGGGGSSFGGGSPFSAFFG